MEYTSLVPDVAYRSRELKPDEQLNPPAEYPGLFTCAIRGRRGIGCIFRSGVVAVIPDHIDAKNLLMMFVNMAAVDEADYVTDIIWEWQITRRLEDLAELSEAMRRPVVPAS